MTGTPETVTVNGRDYAWPERPVVVVCIDGSEPDYIERAVADGVHRAAQGLRMTGADVARCASMSSRFGGESRSSR